jgi:nucleoside-diphosphate-sugar epimerase
MKKILITGSSGFLGEELVNNFSEYDFIYAVDKNDPINFEYNDYKIKQIRCDIGNYNDLEKIFKENQINLVIHSAAELLYEKDSKKVWKSNYNGTKNLLNLSKKYSIDKFVFTSSSAVFEKDYKLPIDEDEPSSAIDDYGKSKYAAERFILNHDFNGTCVIFRCPLIIGEKRLDKLALLFEMVKNDLNIWVVGNGKNKIQFIHSFDLIKAIEESIKLKGKHLFNIGSDSVKSLNSTFQDLLNHANSKKEIKHFPKVPGLILLKLFNFLGLVPFGPYHRRFLISNSVFNTEKIKKYLKWKPTYTNEKMLSECYDNYVKSSTNYENKSSSKKLPNLTIIKLLKFLNL